MTSSELDEAMNQRKLELAVMHAIPSIPRYEEIHYPPSSGISSS